MFGGARTSTGTCSEHAAAENDAVRHPPLRNDVYDIKVSTFQTYASIRLICLPITTCKPTFGLNTNLSLDGLR